MVRLQLLNHVLNNEWTRLVRAGHSVWVHTQVLAERWLLLAAKDGG